MREHAAVLLGFALSVLPGPQHPTPGPERSAAWSEPPSLVQEVRERIRTRLEAGDIPGALVVDGERIHARDALSRFYEERAFEPAWIDEGGPSAATDELVAALRGGEDDGLRPADYHAPAIAAAIEEARRRAAAAEAPDPDAQAELELLATDGFLLVASHLWLGRVDPEDLDPKWVANRRDFDAVAALKRGLEQGVAATITSLRPPQLEYENLRAAYRRYRVLAAAGRWSSISEGPRLEAGMRDSRVRALRARLASADELAASGRARMGAGRAEDPELFDETLDRAVRAFQRRHGLAAAGGGSSFPAGPGLVGGWRAPGVRARRPRLESADELAASGGARLGAGRAEDPELFDETLDRAVRAFQRRHGLAADGVVGPATLAALNVPPAERARQIRLNLERWRWLPADLGRRHVIVNAANYELGLVEDGQEVFTSRVVVGRPYRRTPVFSDRITYVVLSPYWHVPHSLAVQDHLPIQRRDPGYFQRIGMRVFRGWGEDAAEVDPATVDWDAVSARSFPYRLRQDPGPQNFLGGVKIMFPNRFNVYLHDTPARELFGRSRRDFSSGCIRVEGALELTELLLRDVPGWDMARLRRSVERRREETVRLATPVPVHLLYLTAWAESDGPVQFREDIYGRDGPLLAALGEPPPKPEDPLPSTGAQESR